MKIKKTIKRKNMSQNGASKKILWAKKEPPLTITDQIPSEKSSKLIEPFKLLKIQISILISLTHSL
jgi:hypothetical protein